MNFIEQIRQVMGDNCEVIKLSIWTDEMVVYLWEEEIGISVFPKETGDKQVVFDIEGYDWKLSSFKVNKIGEVMTILETNMNEISQLTKYLQ